MRRAKIICTIGPAVHSAEAITQLVMKGMNVARLNFSHGDHADHAQAIEWLRTASQRHNAPLAILADLQGPKIRTGKTQDGKPLTLHAGQQLVLTTDLVPGTTDCVSVTYPHLPEDVSPGDRILLDDGHLELRVRSTDKVRRVVTEIIVGGSLGQHKGINLPGVPLRTEALTTKDRLDLEFALTHGVDYVALSFVRHAGDLTLARQAMHGVGRVVPLIAKIEKPEALTNLETIITTADAVMVARGDLGVELTPERVPVIQKEIIQQCNRRGRPVIIATQMLNSMIENPRPTRAEASDVANAVFDGADAVMLSGETASGRYPLEALAMMDRIVRVAEEQKAKDEPRGPRAPMMSPGDFPEVTCEIACRAAQETGAVVIAAFTRSGLTARLLSHFRPVVPVVAFSSHCETRRQLALLWGVIPRAIEPLSHTQELVERAEKELVAGGFVRGGDRIVLVFGAPVVLETGPTNSLRLHKIANGTHDVHNTKETTRHPD
jgi:pyruvate kinase